MIITPSRRLARYAVLPVTALAVAGVAHATAGAADAGTLPTDGPTIAMTITNATDAPMVLQDSSNPYGQWMSAPRGFLAPHSTEIVTAYNNDPNGVGVDVTYALPGGAQAVFAANNYRGASSLDGTRITGVAGAYGINPTLDTGFPNLNAGYVLVGHP
ncbi:hypothetical protein FK531_10950 [Rhodococcus spelaei]|uniref:MPT63-like domain-containing protein n=1 Tax=Rhodococcus spelaei TaxID=2546320 RepID=A0A541BAE7_9NOCA|nr:hypothetical protein [Rhodococcus spelaei]TQF69253.1 hypothetical protein FK531_10950 [Rhodococcus spelaei]